MDDGGVGEAAGAEAGRFDSGASGLALLLQLLGLPADQAELLHQSGMTAMGETDILRAAQRFPVKARAIASSLQRLETTPLPALALLRNGDWLVLGKAAEGKVLVQDPLKATPELMTLEAFDTRWSGRLILMTRRASLGDPHARFGVGWFVDAVKKYRAPLTDVLIGSFFLQVFGLLTPLFFQVIIDKVFTHRGLSTLEVLALGLGILSIFEVILGGLRTYLFAHTSNRIDVELGARLFRHLFALPMAYFQARRVGRHGGAGARTGHDPAVPDLQRDHPGAGSVLRDHLPGGAVHLQPAPDPDRRRRPAPLCGPEPGPDADLP